jgi:phage-related protein
MANLPYSTRELFWIASSKEDLSVFPLAAKRKLGFDLRLVQNGATPDSATPLPEFGPGVTELRASASGNAYRVVYVLKLERGVYVLDAFVKKSKRGKAIAQEVRDRIRRRYAFAVRQDQEGSS